MALEARALFSTATGPATKATIDFTASLESGETFNSWDAAAIWQGDDPSAGGNGSITNFTSSGLNATVEYTITDNGTYNIAAGYSVCTDGDCTPPDDDDGGGEGDPHITTLGGEKYML